LMENHPHDSICGCSIDQVHSEMSSRFDQVDQVGEELTAQSLDTLAANFDTRVDAGVSAVVVFNPLSYTRTDAVRASLDLPPHVTDYDLVDESGKSVPYQTQASGSREIIHMTLSAKEFQVAYGSMADGRAAGMSAQGLEIRKEGAEVFIEAVMSEGGEPNMEAWKTGRKLADSYLADSSITTYHIHAVSATAAQVVFSAVNVPGLGYKTLWIRPRGSNGKSAPRLSPLVRAALPLARLPFVQRLSTPKKYSRPPYVIENDAIKVQAENDGRLIIWDKRSGTTYTGLNAFRDGADCGDEYNYASPSGDHSVTAQLKHVRVCNGPVQQSLELFLEMDVPQSLRTDRQARSKETNTLPITCLVTLTNGVDRIDIHTTVRNSSRDHRLRVHFPAPFAVEAGQYDGHFEVVDRKIGLPTTDETWIEQPRPEVPERAFTDISDGRNGLMIANRGLPEVEVLKSASGNGEIALTLLRCVGWLSRDDFSTRNGHAGPMLETPGAQMQGEWSFDYSIIPHSGGWEEAYKQAYAFETPMRAVNAGLHEGKLPPTGAFVTVEPEQFVISTIKETEDQKGWLVRGYNLAADSVDVRLRPWKAFRKAEQVNLAEKRTASLRTEADGTVKLQVRGHGIVSVRFEE
jgi:alpha-mannosidase